MSGWRHHLKGKVLAFGIAMSVVPLTLLGWFGFATAQQHQSAMVQLQNEAAAKLVSEELTRTIGGLTSPMELMSRMHGAQLVKAAPAEQERLLYTLLSNVPYLEEVALTGADGRSLARVSRRLVTTGQPPVDYAGTPLWAKLSRGEQVLGSVFLDVDGRPLIHVGVPLPEGAGALVARATLRGLMGNIAPLKGTGTVRIHVLDESGRLIGDSDFSLVLAGHRWEPPGGAAREATVGRPVPYRSLTGEDALGAVLPVPALGWRVVGETTVAQAMAPIRRLGWEYGAGALGLMTLVAALSVVAGLQLTRPLERLEAGARRVGAGDLSSRVPAGGRDELGRLTAAFNAMTERLQRQSAALQIERDRLDLVVSTVGAGLALIDAEGRVLWTNRTLNEWFDGPLPGDHCWNVLRRSDCAACSSLSGSNCRHSGAEQPVQVKGRTRLIRYTTHHLGESGPGQAVRLEVLEDVTDRRQMESMVRQSEKLAAVGQLAAGVAHEINNPLAVISAYAEDLNDRLQEEGAESLARAGAIGEYLNQLQVQVQRCKRITTNLLDFARRGPTEPESVDLAHLARQTVALAGPRARKLGVTMLVEAPEGLPPVRATRDQLQQVFLNLITNALDAMAETGAGTIRMETAVDGEWVRLAVLDTGPGMDAATLERAMEPFFTTKPPGKGTGLGLSTSYGIITGLGGSMSIESVPGGGTTVRLALPVWAGREEE